jgi:hypothetical protein
MELIERDHHFRVVCEPEDKIFNFVFTCALCLSWESDLSPAEYEGSVLRSHNLW